MALRSSGFGKFVSVNLSWILFKNCDGPISFELEENNITKEVKAIDADMSFIRRHSSLHTLKIRHILPTRAFHSSMYHL